MNQRKLVQRRSKEEKMREWKADREREEGMKRNKERRKEMERNKNRVREKISETRKIVSSLHPINLIPESGSLSLSRSPSLFQSLVTLFFPFLSWYFAFNLLTAFLCKRERERESGWKGLTHSLTIVSSWMESKKLIHEKRRERISSLKDSCFWQVLKTEKSDWERRREGQKGREKREREIGKKEQRKRRKKKKAMEF